MGRGIFGWDLPPGVHLSDIPGNRPEDVEWEKVVERFYKDTGFSKSEKELIEAPGVDDIVCLAIGFGIKVGNERAKSIEEENRYYQSEYKRPFKEKIRLFFKAQRRRIRELEKYQPKEESP